MSSSSNTTKLVGLVLLLIALAGLAYFFLSGRDDDEATQPTTTEAAQSEELAPAEESKDIVVETKTLKLPAVKTAEIPEVAKSADPEVEAMMSVRKLGSDSAPIKVVEYASLTCGHCSSFHKDEFPKIKTDFIDTGKVQFIFKEFPLNRPAVDASKILRCLPEDKYIPFMSLLFEEQEKWAYQSDYLTPLKQNAKLAGLSEEKIDACLNNKELEARIVGDMKAATDKYKIESTPTFVLNNGAKTIVGHQKYSVFEENFNTPVEGQAAATPAPAETPKAAK